MKKENDFLTPVHESDKSKAFIRDKNVILATDDSPRYNSVVESPEYAIAYKKLVERVIPRISIRDPESFVAYGSAEKYYDNAFTYIYRSYPYDGSALEKVNWSLSASGPDLAVLQHEYPLETGYVTFSPAGWGTPQAPSGIYGLSDSLEYIKFSGGPYVGSVLDAATNRESSLKMDPSAGNTVEFWLKKASFVSSSTESEVVFDSHTVDFAEGASKYGRFLLELSASTGSPLYVTYMSGTAGPDRVQLGQNITTASVADSSFHHYAVTSYHSGSNLTLELYVDGVYNDSVSTAAATFGPVAGYFNAAIGALRTEKDSTGGLGYGKLSGSIDEFRFWKERRTAEQIGSYHDFPVHGATDKESINSVLGVYYKFNEGTVGKDSEDKVVLDYSGRLNNGEIIGYTTSARSEDSAITLSSVTSQTEAGDPIINPLNPKVVAAHTTLTNIGKAFDKNNNSSLFQSLPHWAHQPGAAADLDSDFSVILQAVAQKFDSIRMLIDGIPKIGFTQYKDFVYAKGTQDHTANFYNVLGCQRDFNIAFSQLSSEENFSVQNLLGKGFTIEESPIAHRADLNEYFYNLKSDIVDSKSALSHALMHSKAENLKNKILNSIHTNLSKIYKTKGTADSFRNLIRCFGVDDNLIAPNVYGQNIEKEIKNEPVFEAAEVRSLSFTGSNNSVTLLQTASASNERAYIEGKSSPASLTLESKILFPFIDDSTKTAITASVFGMNEVSGSGLEVTGQNYSGLEVSSIKANLIDKGCYFRLKSKEGVFTDLKTEYFREVYANTPWYLSVRFTEDTLAPLLNSDGKGTQSYRVDFIGYRYDLDVKLSEFHLSASITESDYQNLIAGNKSVFLGANRTNITGSLTEISDVKCLSFSVWDDFLDKAEMQEHAQSFDNIGRSNPLFNKVDNQGASRQRGDSLILNWQFDNVSKPDSSTNYVLDHASGSLSDVSAYGPITGYKYPAVTYNLQNQAASVQQEYIPNIKYLSIDNLASRSKVEIKDREVDVFQLDSRPISYLHSYEKSMYQAISKEMMNMLAGAAAFNNLIGDPVYKYRQEYKSLEKLREKFFARVENEIDLERFIEYYKWIDSSLAALLRQLQPATSAMNLGLEDVVESHVLERSKYKHQAPQLEYKDPKLVGQILGINELLYDWEHGHAPQPVFWAEFDGTGDYIEVSDHDDFSFGDALTDNAFSLAAVIRVVDPTSFDGAIISKYNGNVASEYILFSNNGQLQFNLYDLVSTSRLKTISDAVVLEDGKVHQVVATYDGSGNHSGLKVYLDGALLAQTTSASGVYTAMHNTSTALQLGSSVFGGADFSRNIHHAMIFNSELTADDVTQLNELYNKGILGVDSSTFDKYSDIISWWKMDENDRKSSIANDSIGTHDGTFNGDAHISTEYILFGKEAENCLWWNDRAERDEVLSVSTGTDPDREDLRERRNTVVSGSTYVLRKLTKPYKFSGDRQRLLNVGSNRNANKNKSLHTAIVNAGKQIQVNSSDIYDFKQCNDVLDPQEEKIYTAKTDTSGTEGYLDADADMILPFSLYSSSAGTDFANFKGNLSITNNHDDIHFSLQSPFVREHVGGMPHRRVKFRTTDTDRAEAYALSASSATLTLKPATGPKSLVARGMGLQTAYNVTNIKTNTETTPPVLGNYSKDYEIVLTNGRSINNSYLVESGSIVTAPVAPGYVFGAVDFTSPVRGRAEHIIANQFSSPGGPETQGVYGRDKESGEYSIYNTVNYRNLSVREPLNILSTERSEQFGYRSGSTTQASIHMTNRNYFHSTGTFGEISKPDNQFVQHPIPQNDFSYSWIAASATNSKFEFVKANDGFGHQHMFSTGSSQAIQFAGISNREGLDTRVLAHDVDSSLIDDSFSFSIALNRPKRVLATSARTANKVYLFRIRDGRWAKSQTISPAGLVSTASFGQSLAINEGNTLVIGAPADTDSAGVTMGTAHVYRYQSTDDQWVLAQILTASDGAAGDEFGTSVSINQEGEIFVGAHAKDTDDGAVYVFQKTSGNWSQAQKLSTVSSNSNFGYSAHVNSNIAIIGAPDDSFYDGKAYIYEKSGGTWSESQQITGVSSSMHQFGFSVDSTPSGESLIIGAPGFGGAVGQAYIFEKSGGTWSTAICLTGSGTMMDNAFGISVSIDSANAVVGSYLQDGDGFLDSPLDTGMVSLFQSSSTGWLESNKYYANDFLLGDDLGDRGSQEHFGRSVIVRGNMIIAGAPGHRYPDRTTPGAEVETYGAFYSFDFGQIPITHTGLNWHVSDILSSSTNTVHAHSVFDASHIILHRQGSYGWPSWKQVRGGEHPIIRAHKKNNTFSRVFLGDPVVGASSIIKSQKTPSMNIHAGMKPDILDAYERARLADGKGSFNKSRMVKNYTDVVATGRFSPARLVIHGTAAPFGMQHAHSPGFDHRLPQFFTEISTGNDHLNQKIRESNWDLDAYYYRIKKVPAHRVASHKESFQNDLTTFANMQIAEDTRYKERDHHSFLRYADNILQQNDGAYNRLIELNYVETIYPREINTYTRNARERVSFDYFPWKSTRTLRNILLTGNVSHETSQTILSIPTLKAFSDYTNTNSEDYKKSVYGKYDVVRMGLATTASLDLQINSHISASTWLLDSRKDFSTTPVDINRSYFNLEAKFLTSSVGAQGTRAEGVLQNDFSTFPLGYNNLYGTPPFSTVYNRRIPQSYSTFNYLAGEAKWQAADGVRGPFYDSYSDYSEEIRRVAPDHSIIPEFRMSEFAEKVLTEERSYPNIGDDYLILTGAIYQNSSGDADIGGTFFKTYSNSDFLKYFSLYDEEIVGDEDDKINNISHARINFKCKAAMKFLPYKGFYPAERALEITRLFQNHYLGEGVINTSPIGNPPAGLTKEDAKKYANLRANASRYQASKPLFGPGVLFNSIKSGVAVDYPVFYGDFSDVYTNITTSSALTSFSALSIPTDSTFTGSIINTTTDAGIPRIKSYATKRIDFEDMMSPVNLFGESIYDNEPHPSASLIYGTDHWHRVIERPSTFGNFNIDDARKRLGVEFKNTKEAFSRQLAPYTMAMQNFAAETVNFFVEDGHLTTAMSKPIKERFEKDITYTMRARMTNVDNVMYDRHSSFGPPVDDGGDGVDLTVYTAGAAGTAANIEISFNNQSGSGGASPKYDITTAATVGDLPYFLFRDENYNRLDVYLYTAGVYTLAVDATTQSLGDNVTLYPNSPTNGSTAFINVKTTAGLGSAVAESIATALTSSYSDVSFTVNRSSNILALTSSVVGVQTSNLLFYENASGFKDAVDGTSTPLSTNIWTGSPSFAGGVDADPSAWTTSTTNSKTEHGYMPYVPPFLDPGSDPYVEISFTPTETKEYGAKEIIESSTFAYYNFSEVPSNAATNTNYKHSMSLSASLNLGMCVSLRTDNVETLVDPADRNKVIAKNDVDPNKKLSRWVIQTKWETPVLNFTNVSASALDLSTSTVTAVSGSPWKDRYWDSYYDRGRARAGSTTGEFLTASTGIWHQKGETLTSANSAGYFLQIEDVPRARNAPGLAKKLGFNKDSEDNVAGLKKAKRYRSKIGTIENRKLVKEAIVAIPYVIREDAENRMEFVRFNEKYYDQALKNVQEVKKEAENKVISDGIRTIEQYRDFLKDLDIKTRTFQSDAPVNAIEYQLFMMEDYILPPQLDFLRTSEQFQSESSLKPFMMYFFQFHASFDREDLANIWQNLYPKSATSTASPRYSYTNEDLLSRVRAHDDISYVSHYLETAELNGLPLCPGQDPRALFSPEDKDNKTRWLIFKVKQRGEVSLEKVRRSSIDPRESNVEKLEYVANSKNSFTKETIPPNLPGIQPDGRQDIQFNWPYDYFSFVELIKLETKIDSYNAQPVENIPGRLEPRSVPGGIEI